MLLVSVTSDLFLTKKMQIDVVGRRHELHKSKKQPDFLMIA